MLLPPLLAGWHRPPTTACEPKAAKQHPCTPGRPVLLLLPCLPPGSHLQKKFAPLSGGAKPAAPAAAAGQPAAAKVGVLRWRGVLCCRRCAAGMTC